MTGFRATLQRLALVSGFLLVGLLACSPGAGAASGPVWNLDIHHDQTNFNQDGDNELAFDVRNMSDTDSSGPVTLTVHLPAGITRQSVHVDEGTLESWEVPWECPGSPGDSTFTCTTTQPIAARRAVRNLILGVAVAPGAGPDVLVSAEVSGGGGEEAPAGAGCAAGVGACASEAIHVSPEPAGFGITEGSWNADFYRADGVTPVRQAGSHPDLATFSFDINAITLGEAQGGEQKTDPVGSLRHVEVELPPGFVGAPTAVGECTPLQFRSYSCPPSSQVGVAEASVAAGFFGTNRFDLVGSVFNMVHPLGSVTDLAFKLHEKVVHIKVSLDPANNYAIRTTTSDINDTLRVFNTKVTIWGIPGDASHEFERRGPTGIPVKPFLTLPDRCEGANRMKLSGYDSWENSGVFGPDVFYDIPGQFTGCDIPRFEPEVHVEPTGKQADSPTGLNVHIHIPQNSNPNGTGTPPVKSTVVKLPEGMSFSPSFANGLDSCPLAAMRMGTNDPVQCSDVSRIGEVSLFTPLLPKALEGSIYLAAQYDNPFGSLFAMYLVLHDTEERGVLVKLAGKIEADPVTGQITTTFADTPQLPFEDLTLKFRSGARAPLVNPPFCGSQTVVGEMSSWAQPSNPVNISSTYNITEGAGGASCPLGGTLAFSPGLVAGTLDNAAGSYSPLDLRITRSDGEQEITGFASTLPPGLTANLSGVPFCPEADIALARSKTGAREETEPSCPAASQIGRTIAEAGVGGVLAQAPGRLYMAGPFEGAPFSIVNITSAKVGPYDLGAVVVHLPLSVDPYTATVSVGPGAPDQIPHIIKGVIVHLRNIRVYVDRPNFTLNPTSCERLTFSATVTGSGQNYVSPADDVPVTVTNPFQAADCANLAFKPDFKVATSGKTSKANGASLTVKLAYPNAPLGSQANIHLVKVELPKQLPSRLTTLQKACTAAQFNANPAGCPAASVVGHARAFTPILPVPLEGPAYFVSHGGEAFPSLIVVLQGYGITIDLVGTTFINKQGITSSTFKTVPDQPVSSFELTLPQGPFSALAANGNLCSLTKTVTVKKRVTVRARGHKRAVTRKVKQTLPASLTMPSEFVAQNGATLHQATAIKVTGCAKAKPVKKKKVKKANARKRK